MRRRTQMAGVVIAAVLPLVAAAAKPRIEVLFRPLSPSIDIEVEGRPLASYVYFSKLGRPSLHPILSPSGRVLTAALPASLDPRDVESRGSQFGFFLAHADVNGADYWGGSTPPGSSRPPGAIVHKRAVQTTSGETEGRLRVHAAWVDPQGAEVLLEDTEFVIGDGPHGVTIDRTTRLAAIHGHVAFAAGRHALVGLRADERFWRGPDTAAMSGNGWLAVRNDAGESVALMEHPANPGFPNVIDRTTPGLLTIAAPDAGLTVEHTRSVVLRYRLAIGSRATTRSSIEQAYAAFAGRRTGSP